MVLTKGVQSDEAIKKRRVENGKKGVASGICRFGAISTYSLTHADVISSSSRLLYSDAPELDAVRQVLSGLEQDARRQGRDNPSHRQHLLSATKVASGVAYSIADIASNLAYTRALPGHGNDGPASCFQWLGSEP
jgi:hypothetical protein